MVIYLKIFVTENRSDIEGKMLVMGVLRTPITSIFLPIRQFQGSRACNR